MNEQPQDTLNNGPEGSELLSFEVTGTLELQQLDPQTLQPVESDERMIIPALGQTLRPNEPLAILIGESKTRNSRATRLLLSNNGTLWIYTRSGLYKANAKMPEGVTKTVNDVRKRLGIE
jgi:hypothetical protein